MTAFPPTGWQEFCESVVQKVYNLIRCGIWDRPSIDDFSKWLRNFRDEPGKYIAAYLADKLIYYNEQDVKSLLAWAYEETLRLLVLRTWAPDFSRPAGELDRDWSRQYYEAKDAVLVCPAVADTVAASGFQMVRYLRDMNKLKELQTCSAGEVDAKLASGRFRALILIDDLLGSGTQMEEFWHGTSRTFPKHLTPFCKTVQQYQVPAYLTLVAATVDGLAHLRQRVPCLSVVAGDVLTREWNMGNAEFWRTGEASPALLYLTERVKEAEMRLSGFKGGSWSVAFHHGTPNNCSPLYRFRSSKWHPMIPSREGDE